MCDLTDAVAECQAREAREMAAVEGCDYARMLREVAAKHGVPEDALTEAFINADHGAPV